MGRRFSGDGSAGCGAGTTAQNHVGVVAARVAGAPLPGIRAHTVADLAAGLPHGA
jgi:phenylacetic acid degradation operon negative regulatory protein